MISKCQCLAPLFPLNSKLLLVLLIRSKPMTMWITTNWKILKKMRIPDHQTCLLRYAGQEATVRNRHGTTDWFQTGKGVHQGCMLRPCLYLTYMQSTSCEMPD